MVALAVPLGQDISNREGRLHTVSSFFTLLCCAFPCSTDPFLYPLIHSFGLHAVTHTHTHMHSGTHALQSDKLWALSCYGPNLIVEIIGQLHRRANLVLPVGIQTQLFVW